MRPAHLFSTLLLLAACGDKAIDSGDIGSTGGDDGPAPTWENVRDTVLVPSCGFSSCHAPPGSAGFGVDDATAAEDFIDAPAFQDPTIPLVDPGNPDGSYLLMKLEGTGDIDGDPMPPPEGGMDAARIQLVRDWISGLE